jgi:hypothetical protein
MKKLLPFFPLLGLAFATIPNTFSESQITLVDVPSLSTYPDAAAEGAIQLACGPELSTLNDFFFRQGLPFRSEMVRKIHGVPCHVYYQPTLPGFRAAAADDRVEGLSFTLDPLQLLIPAEHSLGSSFGVIKEMLKHIRRQLRIELSFPFVHERSFYQVRTEGFFDESIHQISLQNRGEQNAPCRWAQDLLKPGFHGGTTKFLVPHRLFEGEAVNGDTFDPLIQDFCGSKRFVRSKLAWEGGDLLFTRDPRELERLILYCGGVAKSYWGAALTPEEYMYILCLEFGADLAVDLSGLAPHVDYFVAFLPRKRIALVSEPRVGDMDMAQSVITRLLGLFHSASPEELLTLHGQVREGTMSPADFERVREASSRWRFGIDHELWAQLSAAIESVCPTRTDCFSPVNQKRMMLQHPNLLGLWVREANKLRTEQYVIQAHLHLIESLLIRIPLSERQRREQKIEEIESLGFTAIRIPQLGGFRGVKRGWPGISYVNSLIVDDMIFVPEFGLGEFEARIFSELQHRLPPGYQVIPVPAADVLMKNGGIHCLAAVIRNRGN